MAVTARAGLVPLFLVSLAAVGYETALTRYFAVAKWSEYGYWVISIVMVGFAFSGVLLALFRDVFARHGETLLSALPALLVATAAIGFHFTTTNPFNPLQLQNPVTWEAQLWNIAGYYACLLPFFFLAGTFVSLSFVLNADRIGQVYGYDLTGAGTGAAFVLAAMFVVHAFFLVPLLLIPLAASACFAAGRRRWVGAAAAGVALLGAEALLLLDNRAEFNDFKAIYAPLHTPDARVVASVLSPRGDYALLDDFTERVDTDISNNAGMLGVPGPPRTFGLYRDGNRIAALPKPGELDVGYAPASLDALPYLLIPHASVLLAGASGGFRTAEVLALGAAHVHVLEPEPVLLRALEHGLGPSPARVGDTRVTVSGAGPVAAVRYGGDYDIIDLSADFLDTAEANVTAFTVQALASDLRALRPGGIVSIPVSIRDFPVYALRVLGTARAALLAAGIEDPAAHVIVYRSAWSARILLSNRPWDAARIATLRKFSDERSFDVSWYPGMDPVSARGSIYNDLPAVSFANGEVTSDGPDDSIADEARPVLANAPTPSRSAFNLAPITLDRPFFYAVLRLDQLNTILQRLEILPQSEIGALVNLAVLAQAVVIALLVLLVPLVAPRRLRLAGSRTAAAHRVFPGTWPWIPLHRDLPDREGQPVAERPHVGLRAGAHRHADLLRAGQHDGGSAEAHSARHHLCRHRDHLLVRHRADGTSAGHSRDPRSAVDRPRRPGVGGARPGVAGARPSLPARPGAHRLQCDAPLGLGAQWSLLRGRHAARQPDRPRGRLQPGSAQRRDTVCGRADGIPCSEDE